MSEYITREDLANHMKAEERLQEITNARLLEGNERMAKIEEDLRPVKALYHVVIGASALGVAIIGLLIYIYTDDKQNVRSLADSVAKQGVVLEKLIQAHQELERDTTREFQRFEKTLEKIGAK